MASQRAERAPLEPTTARLAVPLGRRPPEGGDTLARLRVVLETEAGTVPWRPDLGLDLRGLVGRPATVERVVGAERTVCAALQRWLPETTIATAKARVVTDLGAAPGESTRDLPLAEAALTPFGASCQLAVSIDLVTPEGPLVLHATLNV